MESNSKNVSAIEVAAVLDALADLMANMRASDLALQNALSSLAVHARSSPEMNHLQHVDLLTQTHGDLANFLPTLAAALKGETVNKDALQSRLSLRSLRDTLFVEPETQSRDFEPGDLSMF